MANRRVNRSESHDPTTRTSIGKWNPLSRLRGRALGATLAVGLLLGGVGGATAHHSYGVAYDLSRTVEVQGVIRELRYANPHVELVLDVAGASTAGTPVAGTPVAGTPVVVGDPGDAGAPAETWLISMASVSRAQAIGLTPEFLAEGQTATVVGWPARDGSRELGLSTITIDDETITARR